ncbi:hypothetical protein [Lacinutrix undariae]
MTKHFETGNAKNVANLQKMIEQVAVYPNYNPAVESLTIANLTELYNHAVAALQEVKEARNNNKNAIHKRQDEYETLKPLSTRIINQVEILDISKGVLNQAKSLNHLIQGSRIKKKITNKNQDNQEEIHNTISTSRQSYTQSADNFAKLLQLLTSIESYNPNIEELKTSQLTTYLDKLVLNTKDVDHTVAQLNAKLISRNNLLYADNTGLYTIAQNVKKYVKSLYGATSPEYATISKIKFTSH